MSLEGDTGRPTSRSIVTPSPQAASRVGCNRRQRQFGRSAAACRVGRTSSCGHSPFPVRMPLALAATMRVAWLLLFTTGCGGLLRANTPASLTDQPEVDARTIRTVGDLQVAFALRFVGATDGAPMLTLWLRNEGDAKIPVDVSRLRVEGDGRALQLVDPRGELEPLHVEPGVLGRERVRLADPHPKGELRRVCIDVASMLFSSSPIAPVCFAPGQGPAWVPS